MRTSGLDYDRALSVFEVPAQPRTYVHIALISAVCAAILAGIFLVNVKPEFALGAVAALGAVVLLWGVRYSTAHPMWLGFPLMLVELFTASWFFPDASRAIFHYGTIAIFCLPLLPAAWRNRGFAHDGFRLYLWYFLWAAVTVCYSLAPAFSAGRLICAMLVFFAVVYVVWQANSADEVRDLLTPVLLACAAVVVIEAFSAVALPRSITWLVPDDSMSDNAGDVVRFCGILGGPNDVGELMLVTVGIGAVLWSRLRGRRRLMLAALIVMAMGAGALADSRTPFVGLAVGAVFYSMWKYRARAIVVLLVLGLMVGATRIKLGSEDYLARGNVTTLTGRTDVWLFSLGEIKEHPVLGYGYEVAGAILQSRYFPVWWGPWDLGPHSSLHDGYIDRAVGAGVPALLFWLFIVMRPWYDLFRHSDDPWRLKPVFFLMVIPMMVHNLAEVSISDCTGMVGLTFFIIWAIAERARILRREAEKVDRRKREGALPAAAAALVGGVFVLLAMIALPGAARAQTTDHFPTLAPHAKLPSAAQCARAARNGRPWEPRPGNQTANNTVPTFLELAKFHLAPIKGSFAPVSDFLRVDGNFTGTTDQILRWGACKWGIDEDVVRAEAVVESHWRQNDVGDTSRDASLCPPGAGFPGAWDGGSCQQSYGIMQVKFTSFGGWPLPRDSTAFNVDFRLAYQRACMNGDINYLGQQIPAGDYPKYPYGTTDQMLWGCMGDWFSGSWYDAGAIHYIAEMREALEDRTWMRSGF